MRFVKESTINASAQKVFEFHEAPDAFERLQPPWQTTRIVQPPTSLQVGTQVILQVKVGPFGRPSSPSTWHTSLGKCLPTAW